MNKMKMYKRLLPIMMVAIIGVFFVSCNNDNNGTGGGGNSDIIQTLKSNKWITNDFSDGEGANNHVWADVETWTLYFTSDNSGVEYWVQKDYDTELGNSTYKGYNLFEYNVSGNKIVLTYEDSEKWTLFYQGGILTTEGQGTVFMPSKMTSSDYEFVKTLGPQSGSGGNNVKYSYDDRTQRLTISGKGRMNDYTATNQPWYDKVISEIVIENGVTYIGSHAFHKLKWGSNISKIELPNSVEEIGDYAFCDLGIEEIMVPTGIKKIGNNAFSDCEYLKKVNFAGCDALEEIGESAFAFCPINLGYFTVPKNMKKIGSWAFTSSSCNSLTLNDKLESIGSAVFVKVLSSKLVIPNSVKSIGSQAFRGNFSEIRIGTGLTTIEDMPFVTSKSGKMYINLGIPLEIPLYNYIITNGSGNATGSWELYVPKGCKSAYQNANVWKDFKSINEDSSLTSGNGMPDNSGQGGNFTGTVQGHDYVDLGLSVKWATCNVGASKPEEYGRRFGWGDPTGSKTSTDNSDYPSANPPASICGTKYDMATKNWGNKWRLPSEQELSDLMNKCTWTWTTINGINGYTIVGKNGQSIFLPAAGEQVMWMSGKYDHINEWGNYWSGTYINDGVMYLLWKGNDPYYNLFITSSGVRSNRMSVRAVTE